MNRHRFLGLTVFFSTCPPELAQTLPNEALGGRTPAKGKTQSSHNDSAHSVAHSSLGLLAVDCAAPQAWQGLPLGVLVNGGHQSGAGQDKEPRPGLGFLPWPVTQKYYLSKPRLVTSGPTPQASVGEAQSTAKSPRLLWATEWVKSLWLL